MDSHILFVDKRHMPALVAGETVITRLLTGHNGRYEHGESVRTMFWSDGQKDDLVAPYGDRQWLCLTPQSSGPQLFWFTKALEERQTTTLKGRSEDN